MHACGVSVHECMGVGVHCMDGYACVGWVCVSACGSNCACACMSMHVCMSVYAGGVCARVCVHVCGSVCGCVGHTFSVLLARC